MRILLVGGEHRYMNPTQVGFFYRPPIQVIPHLFNPHSSESEVEDGFACSRPAEAQAEVSMIPVHDALHAKMDAFLSRRVNFAFVVAVWCCEFILCNNKPLKDVYSVIFLVAKIVPLPDDIFWCGGVFLSGIRLPSLVGAPI